MSSLHWAAVVLILLVADDSTKTDDQKRAARLDTYLTALRKGVTSSERVNATKAIGAMGPTVAKEATRDLCIAIVEKNAAVRLSASEALEKVNPKVHKIILPIAADNELPVRLAGMTEIKTLEGRAVDVLPVLLFRVKHCAAHKSNIDAETELLAVLDLLCWITKDDSEVEAAMMAMATTTFSSHVRANALGHLTDLNIDDTKRVVAILTNAVRQDAEENKIIAIKGLEQLGTDARSAIDLLRVMKGSNSGAIRTAATEALAKIEESPKKKKKATKK